MKHRRCQCYAVSGRRRDHMEGAAEMEWIHAQAVSRTAKADQAGEHGIDAIRLSIGNAR